MAVFVTGDIHGNPTRLSKDNFYEQKDFSGNKDDNTVIILGDFGLVWMKLQDVQHHGCFHLIRHLQFQQLIILIDITMPIVRIMVLESVLSQLSIL